MSYCMQQAALWEIKETEAFFVFLARSIDLHDLHQVCVN